MSRDEAVQAKGVIRKAVETVAALGFDVEATLTSPRSEWEFSDGVWCYPVHFKARQFSKRGPQATEPTGSASTSIDLREGET